MDYEKSSRLFSPLVKQSFVTAAICINIVGHGCFVGFPAILLAQLERSDSIISLDVELNSWLAAMAMIPMLAGNFLMAVIMGRLGRRTGHVIVTLAAIIGWLLTVLAKSFMMLVLGRTFLGLSFGLNVSLRAILIAEYTSPRYRGAFLMIISLAQASGIFLVHAVGSLIDWQQTAFACMIIPFISLVMTLHTPESPSYLAAKGRNEECRQVFRWLRGKTEDVELDELITARSHFNTTKNSGFNVFETIKKKEFYKPVIITVHLNAMMQFSGASTMAAYSLLIIKLIVGSEANAAFWMIFLDTQRIVSNLIAVYVINRYKRRTMLFSIGSISVISHAAIAAYAFARNKGIFVYDSIWLPVLLINIHIFTVATGMVPIPNVLAGEIFPFEYCGIAGSIGIVSVAVFSFLVLKTFPSLSMTIGIEGIYAVYALVISYFLIVLWFVLPETRGKTLEQIEEEFRSGQNKNKEESTLKNREEDERIRQEIVRKQSVISRHSLANGVLY